MSNMAAGAAREVKENGGGDEVLARFGGEWSEEFSAYIFPDGSAGAFTDLRNGAQERTSAGEPVLHFVTVRLR